MTLDPQSHLPPGRRAAVDALTSERFSDPRWWKTPPAHTDSEQMRYFRRLELDAASNQDDTEETE